MKISTIIEGAADHMVEIGYGSSADLKRPTDREWDGSASTLRLPATGSAVINGTVVTAMRVPDWEDEEEGVFYLVGLRN